MRPVTYIPMCGLPVFDRPEDMRLVVRQWAFGEKQPIAAWSRLLLDEEGLTNTLDVSGTWLKILNRRFLLDMREILVFEFAHYLGVVASRLPKSGGITVFYQTGGQTWGQMEVRNDHWFTFGLVHSHDVDGGGVHPGADLAEWCPASV